MKSNYYNEMEKIIAALPKMEKKPSLLLHSCCAPCSSSVLETLTPHFDVTLYYYNPNIYPKEEYTRRKEEQEQFLSKLPGKMRVKMIEGPYDTGAFSQIARGYEKQPEGGLRCARCFILRLTHAAQSAKKMGADFFTTTLSVSPHKDAQLLNMLGGQIGEKFNIPFLYADFKKRDGFKRSLALSKQYGLYRQDYCGCAYSKEESEKIRQAKQILAGVPMKESI